MCFNSSLSYLSMFSQGWVKEADQFGVSNESTVICYEIFGCYTVNQCRNKVIAMFNRNQYRRLFLTTVIAVVSAILLNHFHIISEEFVFLRSCASLQEPRSEG